MTTAVIPVITQAQLRSTAPHPGDALTRRQRLVYVLVLGALTALGPFTIDLYLPAFPTLQNELGVSAAAIQLTLTGTMIGFGFGQLIVGPWSDKVGRRLPLMLATGFHILASVGAALSQDIVWLGVFRLLQGFGAAAGAVVALAMVRDLFGGKPLVRMLSRLALISGLAPVLAPVIGSQLLLVMSWRGIFWVLAAYGAVVILAVAFWIVETLPAAERHTAGHNTLAQRYRAVLSDRIFVGVAIIGAMTFTGLFSYLSASSFLFQEVYGFSAQQYGILFAVNSLGIVTGVQLSSRLMHRFNIGPQWIVAVSTVVLVITSAAIVLLDLAGAGLWGTLVPLWFFIAACGFTLPSVQVIALSAHGHEAGTAASLLGAANFGVAGLISPIVGLLGVGNAIPMGAVMGTTALIAIIALWTVVRPRSVPALEH
ncbi:DHA1 family bicyclomycin/chloramphenicol resistance-like MFS transporter [Cryobacterium sp. MP_M5]|uniref:multidrug effflux MFS transporter n=1 Tax=unclassified Cryobacterium TaxID=2649013 RepID=UPI001A294E2C|nr:MULTISPECIES: multidrug effflux MFS transporter [unclassified Cryobacterium]MBG6056861.1 DHA1 family bicyclomycin/chloramphenicol resistance-like MFS transporter [Cryobacterium sp. MP_M3]MEC5175061.1 DHA1 family bicyclomycin/chloramphenicol resistance-like MFS transporter [Cryobacterium sp. MP_M5]